LIRTFKKIFSKKNSFLERELKMIIGYSPRNIHIYILSLNHSALLNPSQQKDSNQRLEYLGDAVLGIVVAEYLFKKFPYKDEGFLTEIRSRLVNREVLNNLAVKIGLHKILQKQFKSPISTRAVYGDTLEALIAAIYLDRGFKAAKKFILNKLIFHHDIEEIVQNNPNYKSMVIEWGQKNNKKVRFEIVGEEEIRNTKEFTAQLVVDDSPVCTGKGLSKKKAEQAAALKGCEVLRIV